MSLLKILVIGDIVGEGGRRAVEDLLPKLKEEENPDFIVANAENAAGGFGVTPKIASALLDSGINVLTSGNHIWDKKEIIEYIQKEKRLIRPANYPPEVPGEGSIVVEIKNELKIGVINLGGRVFLPPIDCPFKIALKEISRLRELTPNIIVDMHAEVTSEKVAMGWYLDGKVSAVFGTHTHIQTADDKILPHGTAYITDIGMTGSRDSVIGIIKEVALKRLITGVPYKYEMAKDYLQLCGIALIIESDTGKAVEIRRIQRDL